MCIRDVFQPFPRLAFAVGLLLFICVGVNSCTDIEVDVEVTKITGDLEREPDGTVKATDGKFFSFKKTIKFTNVSAADVAAMQQIANAGLAVANLPAGVAVEAVKIRVDGEEIDPNVKSPNELDPNLVEKINTIIDNSEAIKTARALDPVIMPLDPNSVPIPSPNSSGTLEIEFEARPETSQTSIPNTFDVFTTFVFLVEGESEYRVGMFDPANNTFDEGFGDVTKITLLSGGLPTVSQWGLIVMAGLLLTAGAIVIVRRRRVAV